MELPAAELRRFAEGAADAAARLRRLSLGGWQGRAADIEALHAGLPDTLDAEARLHDLVAATTSPAPAPTPTPASPGTTRSPGSWR